MENTHSVAVDISSSQRTHQKEMISDEEDTLYKALSDYEAANVMNGDSEDDSILYTAVAHLENTNILNAADDDNESTNNQGCFHVQK